MAAVLGSGRDGRPPLLEQILEHSIKGLDVEIVNRGFSCELAAATGERLKVEVALAHPDVCCGRLGPTTRSRRSLSRISKRASPIPSAGSRAQRRRHSCGLNYIKQLAKNEHYQGIRKSLSRITQSENVLRITRYEAMEVLERTMRVEGRPEPSVFGQGEQGYNCMAQYVAPWHRGGAVRQAHPEAESALEGAVTFRGRFPVLALGAAYLALFPGEPKQHQDKACGAGDEHVGKGGKHRALCSSCSDMQERRVRAALSA